MSFGLGWVGDTPGFNGDLNAALASIKAKALFILSPQDQFIPPPKGDADVKAIPNARAAWIDSSAGHLICCNADPNATRRISDEIKKFLRELSARGETTKDER
jgi:homoserine O-acetyltransferase